MIDFGFNPEKYSSIRSWSRKAREASACASTAAKDRTWLHPRQTSLRVSAFVCLFIRLRSEGLLGYGLVETDRQRLGKRTVVMNLRRGGQL